MKENYYALLICILRPVTIEQSFEMMDGKIAQIRNKSITSQDVEDMIRMKQEGMTCREIGKLYGISWDSVRKRISRYKSKEVKPV